MRTVRSAPSASILIESMRDIGYTLETAIADIVDNSISAGAKTIDLFADTSTTDVRIGIIDDGAGMTESTLLEAMRLGSRNPLDDRDPSDLGRFGLGLKTASFSQCRRLTVVSRRNGRTSAARWDLDYVAKTEDWLLQVPDDPTALPWFSDLGNHGTLVLWEDLDRIVEKNSADQGLAHFIQRLDDARGYLELVFHRFLAGERGLPKFGLRLNNRPLEPFDPFFSTSSKTDRGPVEKIKVGRHVVVVQTYTLPHHGTVSSRDWEHYAGRGGYIKNQGFYVYRAGRLIIYGTWFGLARQTELTKLARVKIDIPNGLDAEWTVNVMKASGHPPYPVRERLRRLIDTIGAPSRYKFTEKGRKLISENRLPVWNRIQDKGQIIYRINRDHPVVVDFLSRLPEKLSNDFLQILEMAGSALPMNALFADLGGDPQMVTGELVSDETLSHVLEITYNKLREAGIDEIESVAILRVADPFKSNWKRTDKLLAELTRGNRDA